MAANAAHPPRAAPRKISFLFPRTTACSGHCAGVNALALSETHLWTGSRDSTVCCWDIASGTPTLLHKHLGHIDWVNGLALGGDVLVSCSSDKTLRVWKPDSPGPALGCLQGHSDYVTAVSMAGSMLASGGLQGEVLLWDLATLRNLMSAGSLGQGYTPINAEVPKASVYSITLTMNGNLVAAGSTQGSSTFVDARTGQTVFSLHGHKDNIRAMQFDASSRLLLTGSSDRSIKVWDLGQRRCLQTLFCHTDSVYTLAASSNFSTIYSGGRDGCIYRTRLASRISELLACEQHPVLQLAVSSKQDCLWAAGASSSVHKWVIDSTEATSTAVTPRSMLGGNGGSTAPGTAPGTAACFVASPSAAARARMSFELHGSHPPPRQVQPDRATPGISPIQHVAVLSDRRHCVTQDANGCVMMWDVTTGTGSGTGGAGASLTDVCQQLFDPAHSVSAWFAPDIKLGSLAGTLEAPQCFSAEIYAVDLGDEQAPIDLKVNFGAQMLKALLAQWAQQQQQQQASPYSGEGDPQGGSVAALQHAGSMGGSSMSGSDSGKSPSQAFCFRSESPPVVMVTGSGNSLPWRCPIDSFTGKEDVPQWAADCVLTGHYPVSRELKMAFQLLPLPGSGLPSLLQSKLNAPRVLRVNKVAGYLIKKFLEDHNIALREEPLLWDASKHDRWHAEQQQPASSSAQQSLLIVCNGHTVPWDFSLAAVKKWIWKRSDDLVLHFSTKESFRGPLKLPAIRLPS